MYSNYDGRYKQQQQSDGYYSTAAPAVSSAAQYQPQTVTAAPDRYQYSRKQGYGAYNRGTQESTTSERQYSHAQSSQSSHYSQTPNLNQASSFQQDRPSQAYYASQRQNSTTPNDAPARSYTNLRAEAPQRASSAQQSQAHTKTSTTVNPTQVYDDSHEVRRRAKMAEEEATKRKQVAEPEAARRAEVADREAAERESAAEARRLAEEGAKKAANAKKTQKPAAKSKRKSKDTAQDANQMQAAAMTLMRTANAGGSQDQTALEAQMKEMFKKMREFNQQDPDMLSRLWQQERDDHLAKESAASTSEPPTETATPMENGTASASQSRTVEKQKTSKPSQKSSANGPATRPTGQAATQSSAASTSTGPKRGTVWPAGKKMAIAEAAFELLKTMPGNNGHTIPSQTIIDILDGSPSFAELRDSVGSKGVNVDRSRLARQLIESVSDVHGSSSSKAQPDVPEQEQNGKAQKTIADAEKRLMKRANIIGKQPGRPNNGEVVSSRNEKSKKAIVPEADQRHRSLSPMQGMSSLQPRCPQNTQLGALGPVKMFVDGQWVEPSPSSRTSKGQERKVSNKAVQPEPSPPPGPTTKHDLARKRNFNDLIDLTKQLSDDEDPYASWNPPAKRRQIDQDVDQAEQLPTPPTTNGADGSPAPVAPTASMGQSGQARSSGPPQATFAIPRPTASLAPTLPRDHPARQSNLAKPLDKHKALRRSSYDIRNIARDVLLACGRHPDMRHLNAHLEALKGLNGTVDTGSDLSTFRWDLVDPGGPAPGSNVEALPPPPPPPIDVDADDEDSDNDSVLGHIEPPLAAPQAIGMNGLNGYQTFSRSDMLRVAPKKRGRPRMSETDMRTHAEDRPTPGRPGRPRQSEGAPSSSKASATPGTAITYAELREQQETQGPGEPKKRGRPKGWRKWMQADQSASKGTAGGRAQTSKKQKSPSPHYQVWKCEWKSCGVELHNLETLRRHVQKLHGKADRDGLFYCRWKDCGKNKTHIHTATGRDLPPQKDSSCSDREAWKAHIEEKHISPIAWKLGDGPKGGVSDNYESEVSESYMSDAQGRRVTPRAVSPDDDGPSRFRSKAEREAEQTRREAEQRARNIGPSVDRGGATFVNDKNRSTLRDDYDMVMVVDEDDD